MKHGVLMYFKPWLTHDLIGSCGLFCILSTRRNPLYLVSSQPVIFVRGVVSFNILLFYMCIIIFYFAKQTRTKTNQHLSVHNYSPTTTLPHSHHPKSGLCTFTCCRCLQVCLHDLSPSIPWNIPMFHDQPASPSSGSAVCVQLE